MSKFGFKADYSRGDVQKQFENHAKKIHKAIVTTLQYIGELCVRQARENGSYNDITGNLRNSIGYVIVYKGSVLNSNFEERITGKAVSNLSGLIEGKKLAYEIAAHIQNGYAVIVVAGMNYAAYVESMNKDVLDSAERLAQRVVPKMMQQLQNKL